MMVNMQKPNIFLSGIKMVQFSNGWAGVIDLKTGQNTQFLNGQVIAQTIWKLTILNGHHMVGFEMVGLSVPFNTKI